MKKKSPAKAPVKAPDPVPVPASEAQVKKVEDVKNKPVVLDRDIY